MLLLGIVFQQDSDYNVLNYRLMLCVGESMVHNNYYQR